MRYLIAILFLLFSSPAFATTWYVRTDGGDTTECTGQADAQYPGSGTGQACAYSHPFYATGVYGDAGSQKIQGGDTLIIKSGSYAMGYGWGETWGACDSTSYTYDCRPLAIPDGTAEAHTKIYGEGYDTTCSNPPELYGIERIFNILNLNNSDYVDVDCLNITDHEACGVYSSLRSGVFDDCVHSTYSHGDYGVIGIEAYNATNLTITDVKIHGLSEVGIWGGKWNNVTLTNVDIYGNGLSGVNLDYTGSDDSNSGDIQFLGGSSINYNGCVELYPNLLSFGNCIGQGDGGYGDGLGTAATGGDWYFSDFTAKHNTQDGIDLLYVTEVSGGTVTAIRSWFEGNAGNQLKTQGDTTIENSALVGNCDYFWGSNPGNTMRASGSIFADCRADGSTLVWEPTTGGQVKIYNSTLTSRGFAIVETDDSDNTGCDDSELIDIQNTIFHGNYDEVYHDGNPDDTVFKYDGGTDGNGSGSCGDIPFSVDYSFIYNVRESGGSGAYCPTGTSVTCTTPSLEDCPVSDYCPDIYLTSGSGAMSENGGAADETLTMTNGSNDVNNFVRGSAWDIGALEYGSTPGGDTPECGNNLKESGETCDGTDLDDETCVTQGYDSGDLSCAANCLSFVVSECVVAGGECGDSSVDEGEECDDGNTNNSDGCSAICQTEVPGLEKLLLYTETDPGDNLGVETHKVNIVNLTHTTDTTLRYDYGASHFSDFKHRFKVTITSCSDNGAGEDGGAGLWAMSSTQRESLYDLEDNSDGLVVSLGCLSSAARHTWKLYSADTDDLDTFEDSAPVIVRYFEVERSGTALTAKIYSDYYSTLLDTLSVTTAETDYRYFYTALAYNDSVAGTLFTGSTENFNLTVDTPASQSSFGCSSSSITGASVR